jgi:hypothetical protein
MKYSDEPWCPIWDYSLNWTGDFTEFYTIKEKTDG